jgi:hypothetical protein
MRKSTRIFILLGIIEALIIAGAIFMVFQVTSGAWNAPDPSEAISRILAVAGGAIPLVGLPFVILAISLLRKGE